jgi:phospholipid/cholesterol/gamma-HCH transport system substrate-binding protein
MASPRSIEVKVGMLILAAIALLGVLILIMGGVNFQPSYTLFVDFDNPGSLQTGAPVKIASVKVGKIDEIQFRGGDVDPATGKRQALIRVKISIEKRRQSSIHANGTFYVTSAGLLGEQYLAIEPGSHDQPVLPDGAVVRGIDPPRLDMLIAETYELLHSSVSVMRENREQIGEAFDGLRKTLKGTGDFFHKNGDRLDRIAANVETITVTADDTLKGAKEKFVDSPQIDRILGNVEGMSGTAARDLPPLMADVRTTMGNMKRLSDTLGSEEEQKKLKKTLSDVSEIASRAKGTMGDAQAIVSHIRRGKGTVGAVVMDEALYDDIQELARDLKHNPWKFLWRE